jgi:hypothetical protein
MNVRYGSRVDWRSTPAAANGPQDRAPCSGRKSCSRSYEICRTPGTRPSWPHRVTHVSGTKCHLCPRPHTQSGVGLRRIRREARARERRSGIRNCAGGSLSEYATRSHRMSARTKCTICQSWVAPTEIYTRRRRHMLGIWSIGRILTLSLFFVGLVASSASFAQTPTAG